MNNKKVLVLTRTPEIVPPTILYNGVEYATIAKDLPDESQGHCKGVLGICNERLVGIFFDSPSRYLSPDEILYIWARMHRTLVP